MTFQKALQDLYVTGNLLSVSSHRWIGTLTRCKALQVGNPEVLFNQLITTVGFALVGEFSAAHGRYFDEGLFTVSKRKKTPGREGDSYRQGRQFRGSRAISLPLGCHHDSDELDMPDIGANQRLDYEYIYDDVAVVYSGVDALTSFPDNAVELAMALLVQSTWAYGPGAEVLYYHDKGSWKLGREVERCQLHPKGAADAVGSCRIPPAEVGDS
jgi:hypothetical protein